MYNDNFLIEENDLDLAKDVCKLITNENVRNRAVANVVAAGFAEKYFEDFEVNVDSGLHNVYQVLEDLDISDIYIKNNYIDVRLYFNENELFVPKSHFDNNLLPVAYMFIKVDEDLSNALVTGFIVPSSINTDEIVNGFYRVDENELVSFYDVEPLMITEEEPELSDDFNSQIFDYLDGKLGNKNEFYSILLKSREARENLKKAAYAKTVFNFVSLPNENVTESIQNETLETEELFNNNILENASDVDLTSPMLLEECSDVILNEVESPDDLLSQGDNETVELFDVDNSVADLLEVDVENSDIPDENAEILDVVEDTIEEHLGEFSVQELNFEDNTTFNLNEEENDETVQSESLSDDVDATITEDSAMQIENLQTIEDCESIEFSELMHAESEDANSDIELDSLNESLSFSEFSTNTTPSIDSYDEVDQDSGLTKEMLDAAEATVVEDIIPDSAEIETALDNIDNSKEEQINDLFKDETKPQEDYEAQDDIEYQDIQKKKSPFVPLIGLVAIVATVGYYSYTKFVLPQNSADDFTDNSKNIVQASNTNVTKDVVETAMPVETVENVKLELNTNEENAVSVPTIEQNIDATISVSNLRVEFEVPLAYKASKTAERYFTKMGKIIQMNLKTELLLLTKQPITNKIAVELEYNKTNKNFDVKGLTSSSGENLVDEVILKTVKNALNRNLNMNTSAFAAIQGNPVLIIKL